MGDSQKRWVFVEADPIVERRLMDELDVGPITARILAGRGLVEPAEVKRFFAPRLAELIDPDNMLGAPEAARRIADAIERGETVAVYGDYDADGVTSTALIVDFFRHLRHPIIPYIPDRFDQGYGLTAEPVVKLAERGAKLLITVDCGVNDYDAVAAANAAGMDVIITDHHELAGERPPALAILNPHQPECGFHGEPLAGVGVAFFLVGAVRKELTRRKLPQAEAYDLKSALDLVALGTVADIVPLVGLNRILVHHGLPLINQEKRPGLAALKQVANVKNPVRCGDIGFRLAPRINAAGRLGDASIGMDLLLTCDMGEAQRIAKQLAEENMRRQMIESGIFNQAQEMFEKIARKERLLTIVLAHPEWHPGVIGIVASKMVDKFHRPTILFAAGEGASRGSGRSIAAFNIFEALQACEGILETFGGHAQAAGVQVKNERLVEFAKAFDAYARTVLKPEDMVPLQRIDTLCEIDEIGDRLVRELSSLAPFGFGNSEPVLGTRDVRVLSKRIVGNDHLKLRVAWRSTAMPVIAYGRAAQYERIGSRIDLAYSPEFNNFGGVQHIQLRVKDLVIPDAE
ncbi:MAG TPA: single-stranded-DNA-specific exonuclease RecJ [bacterium]|nr:single-stranded-DNA-specific exonuclease RecJ [bacterium]